LFTAKIIGKMWRDESETIKKQWKDKAESVKRQHLRDHPDYQYQPRKPHEKKRRMTKRKAMALAAQQNTPAVSASTSATASDIPAGINTFSPTPSTTGPFSSVTSPAQIVDLANFDDPSFHYSANGDLASFTLDTFQPNQLDLFNDLLDDHNTEMMFGPTTAQSDLTSFESSIEDMLARELQNMEQDGGLAVATESGFQYNDLESQRFTEFLEQMPEHM
jgi:hypothetical protein